MSVISPQEKKVYGMARKRWGKPPCFGQLVFGLSDYGSDMQYLNLGADSPVLLSGIYQVRTQYNKKVCVREKYYMPKDPKTAGQVARRSVFASAVSAWQALSDEVKEEYKKLAYCQPKSGYNIFLGEYLKSH